ncbi:MAG: hypothetical protein WC966_03255 [Bradymonadales bacterium]|jgi:type II secretory pathway component PulC
MQHIVFAVLNIVFLFVYIFFLGCASTSGGASVPFSEAQESRYWEAVREDEARKEAERAALQAEQRALSDLAQEQAVIVPARKIDVELERFDAFFAHGPAHALGFLQLAPVRDGVELVGYEIQGFPRGALRSVDLALGDVILAIDGELPRNPERYFSLWEKIGERRDGARLSVLRRSEAFDIVWHVIGEP